MDVIDLNIFPINTVTQISRLTDFSAGQYKIIESTANDLSEETSCEIASLGS